MKKYTFIGLLFFIAVPSFGQDTLPIRPTEIPIDIDSDGKMELLKITEYLKTKKCDFCPTADEGKRHIKYYYEKAGDTITFFEHPFSDYLSYGINRFEDLNYDGLIDAVYYQGDEMEEETVLIINQKDSATAHYLGTTGGEFPYEINSELMVMLFEPDGGMQSIANWKNDHFIGSSARWVNGVIPVFSEPNPKKASVAFMVESGTLIVLANEQPTKDWKHICISNAQGKQCGWVRETMLLNTPPQKVFK